MRKTCGIYIDTLGCFKNAEDSERAAGLLAEAGYAIVGSPDDADVILVNTCGFIEAAKRESIDRVLEMIPHRETGKKLIVSGCLTQRYPKELLAELPEADIVMGVNDYGKLPGIVAELLRDQTPRAGTRSNAGLADPPGACPRNAARDRGDSGGRLFVNGKETLLLGPRRALSPRASALLKVAEGCDNRCSYCAIPYIRGAYRSVPMELLVAETERLAREGAKEIVLIAQDVSAYGSDVYGRYALPELLSRLCAVEGPEWFRLMYCYEERITRELIEVMAREPKICAYIDIPLQHCADGILTRMNRRSRRADIDRTLAALRDGVPDLAIRTTLMTGFPGETDEDFAALEDFVEENRFERLGVFAYSAEDGTPAADMPDKPSAELSEERKERLMLRQLDISLENNRNLVGKTLRVLTEGTEEPGIYAGRTQFDAPEIDNAVLFTSGKPLRAGDMVNVTITDAMDYDIVGEIAD
ncbi:MAG: 30S ribosomal protein S12 methylthiotransferase RimO [Clostridiales Family XIII bacterium]|jgi:ribosomal protein S12 methylthiotransferase|nr:30S ribosomal protein S12 methylthiotransferase RimO [Clostridiales Family XIII bacterium]